MLLHSSIGGDIAEEDPDLSFIDDDPLTYFLTPPPSGDDDDSAALIDFDFDAGIEDAKRPPPIVRSVSPSSLGGLSLPPPRPPSPPRSPPAHLSPDPESATDDDDDDDDEDYVRYGTGRFHAIGLPFGLGDFAVLKARKAAKSKAAAESLQPPAIPAIHGPVSSSSRGRPVVAQQRPRYGSPRGRSRGLPSRRRSPHAWREPSPDVWSIEEEPEEELDGEMGGSAISSPEHGFTAATTTTAAPREEDESNNNTTSQVLDPSAAKPKKRVRFILPAVEI